MIDDRCQSLAASGKPCSANVVDGAHCAWHSVSPEWAAKRRQWSVTGGKNRSNAARAKKALPDTPMSTAELHSWLGLMFKRVLTGKAEPNVGTACASIAKAMAELNKAIVTDDVLAELSREVAELSGRKLT